MNIFLTKSIWTRYFIVKAKLIKTINEINGFNMKAPTFYMITFFLLIVSCAEKKETGDSLARKRITQKIDVDAMGMLKDFNLETLKKVNDTTYLGIHTFLNPLVDKEMRVTRNYIFTLDLDSIIEKKDLKIEMKSEGELVKTGF